MLQHLQRLQAAIGEHAPSGVEHPIQGQLELVLMFEARPFAGIQAQPLGAYVAAAKQYDPGAALMVKQAGI